MTREEAIKRLKEARSTIQPFRYVDEAIDYAIKALEQEPCNVDTCKIALHYMGNPISILPKVPCDDAVSRQVLKEQMIKYGFHAPDMTVTEFVEDLPPVLPKREENTVSEEVYTEEYTRRKALEYENYVLKQNMQALR